MANRLVPFIQDEKKWTEHYMAQARKQIAATRVPQLKEFVQPEIVQPKFISPIAKLLAQAESEFANSFFLLFMQDAFCRFSCSEVCAGLGNGCESFARRDLC